jgi:hypothetical protein
MNNLAKRFVPSDYYVALGSTITTRLSCDCLGLGRKFGLCRKRFFLQAYLYG